MSEASNAPTITERLRAQVESLRRRPTPLADLIPLLQQAVDEIERLQRDGPIMKRGTRGDGSDLMGTMRECLEDARQAAAAAASLGDEARARLRWCYQCGEGTVAGLCRRPRGTERPDGCAAERVLNDTKERSHD